jgi:hypothetical protein
MFHHYVAVTGFAIGRLFGRCTKDKYSLLDTPDANSEIKRVTVVFMSQWRI